LGTHDSQRSSTRLPFLARLAPDIDDQPLVRWRHRCRTQLARTELRRDRDRRGVIGADAVDHLAPPAPPESPVDGDARRLERVALAPERAGQRPADFGTGPAFRLQRTDAPDPVAAALLDHGETGETLQVPAADREREIAPRDRARLHAA